MLHILCVDDEVGTREMVRAVFDKSYQVHLANDVNEAREILRQGKIDIILLDQAMPETDGLTFLEELKRVSPEIPVLIITAVSSDSTLAAALRLGAVGLVAKPFDIHELRHLVKQATAAAREPQVQAVIQKGTEEAFQVRSPIGMSAVFQKMLRTASEMVKRDFPLLISGEKGTGKELLARYIHALGTRSKDPFYPIRCGQHSEDASLRELFGDKDSNDTEIKGAIELVGAGCLYLEGAERLSAASKEKVAKALEENGNGLLRRARLIVSTTAPERLLKELPASLSNQLKEHHLIIPALRDRAEDIPLLAYHFVNEFKNSLQSDISEIGSEAIKLMRLHAWPGNVRELRNVIERACLVYDGEKELQPCHLPKEISLALYTGDAKSGLTYEQMIEDFERAAIVRALERTSGNITKAAELLGTTHRIVSYRITTLNLKKYTTGNRGD